MALTREDLENIYELTYKYQMLRQEAALGDYGVPQQLPDNAYMAFEKIKQELADKLDEALPHFQKVFSDWLEHHVEQAGQELYESLRGDIKNSIRHATSYAELTAIFNEDELREALISANSELEQFSTVQEMIEYTESLDPTTETAILKEVKNYLAEHPDLNEIVEELVVEKEEDYHDESAISGVQSMLDSIESAYGWNSEANLDDLIRIFQEALTTAHNNGSMAEYLIEQDNFADRGTVEFLSGLSNNPAYAEKWNKDLTKLLGYPLGSRTIPKSDWFVSSHLKRAMQMLAKLVMTNLQRRYS